MVPQSAFLPQKKKAQVDEADDLERVVTTGGDPLGDVLFWENMGSKWKTDVGPQMEMSSLVLTIQLLGYLILTHTHMGVSKLMAFHLEMLFGSWHLQKR